MKEYCVDYHECYSGRYYVRANSEEEADEIVRDKIMSGEFPSPENCYDSGSVVTIINEDIQPKKTLLEMLLDAGYPKDQVYHHCSDLYVYVTPVTTKIIDEWCKENGFDRSWHCPVFRDEITGKLMCDCAFQYYEIPEKTEEEVDDYHDGSETSCGDCPDSECTGHYMSCSYRSF